MLPHLILFILQILGAWQIGPRIKGIIPSFPSLAGYNIDIFIWALVFAVIVFVMGFIGSVVLKGVRTPGAGTLSLSVLLALIFAALTFVAPVTQAVGQILPNLATLWWPLIGAMVGYIIKR